MRRSNFSLASADAPSSRENSSFSRSSSWEPSGERGGSFPPRRNEQPMSRPLPSSSGPHPIPTNPPFTAYLGNLPYEAEEKEIKEFFAGLHVRLSFCGAIDEHERLTPFLSGQGGTPPARS